MSENESVEVVARFEWDLPEYTRVVRHGLLGRILIRTYALCTLLLLCAIFVTARDSLGVAAFLYGFFGMYVLLAVIFREWLPRRVWKKGPGVQGPQEVSLSDNGVSTKSNRMETKANWDVYLFAEEWKSFYFLKRTKRVSALAIPKRGFESKQDEDQFRKLLLTHTKAKLIEHP